MLRRAGPLSLVACLVGCVPEEPPPSSGEPLYTLVFFASGSATLGKAQRQQVAEFVEAANSPVKTMPRARVCVVGHSDNVGPEPANRELAQRRADGVVEALASLGVARDRIVAGSAGSTRPLVVTGPGTPEISNRRVEIVVGGC